MNILREIKKVNQLNMPIRIILLLTFCVIFTASTYAWFAIVREVNIGGLQGNVNEVEGPDVAYYVGESEILDETVTFTLNSLYPGMPFYNDTIDIYNTSDSTTEINFEIVSVKLFGEEIYNEEFSIGVSNVGENGKKYTIFSEDTQYPFNISFQCDKSTIEGTYVDDGSDASEKAHATFDFNANWTFQAEAEDGESLDDEDIKARDDLDTQFGEAAFEYYNESGNEAAIEIKVKITSTRIG